MIIIISIKYREQGIKLLIAEYQSVKGQYLLFCPVSELVKSGYGKIEASIQIQILTVGNIQPQTEVGKNTIEGIQAAG